MFTRSMPDQNGFSGNYINIPIDGVSIGVRSMATDTPNRLGLRIAEGEDIIAIWFDWEHQANLQSISQRLGYHLPSTAGITGTNLLPSIHDMTPQEILDFCKAIKVHPAHLIPLKSEPEYSLPTPLLEALIEIKKGRGKYSTEDIHLAKAGIAVEKNRIHRFLYDQSRSASENKPSVISALKLAKVFSDVLDSPRLMEKLVREFAVVSDVREKYPLAMCVRNVAFSGLTDTYLALIKSLTRADSMLDEAVAAVEKEFSPIFDPSSTNDKVVSFINDIKDGLHEHGIAPLAATYENVAGIIRGFDMTDSPLEKSFHALNGQFGCHYSMDDATQGLINDLAENIVVYFATEVKVPEMKREYSKAILKLPLCEDIGAVFEQTGFQKGTLFRCLMDNSVIIALDAQASRAHPTAAPN
jgi:hypothetical protein